MHQSKSHSRLSLVILMILSFILTIPRTYQLDNLLSKILSAKEMMFFINYRSFFILLGIFLEVFGTLFSIVILKYLYHFAKLKINMIMNANIYLASNIITKIIALLLPLTIVSKYPYINNLLFLIAFMSIHFYLDKEKNNQTHQWGLILIYPMFNLILGFI